VVLASFLSLPPPPSKTAKVLEIGCSYGGNLFPFAIANPQAKALGIDLSEVQINKAKELAAQMRVDNIKFIAKDICDFTDADMRDYGKFDYIAHPDLYVINYRNWDESCEKAAHIISEAAEKMDVPLEVNANGIRKTLARHLEWDRYMYPYKEFWEIVAKYNVRTIIGSDTHDFMEMEDEPMEMARTFAKELGLNVIESIF